MTGITTARIDQLQKQLTWMRIVHWEHHEILTAQWYLALAMITVPWVVWWFASDKDRLCELFGFAMTVSYVVTVLDGTGVDLGLWSYPIRLTPYNRLFCVDTSVLPVIYSLLYMYFPRWRSYLIANVLFAAFASFLAEPFYVWIDMYQLIHWRYVYSFPIYIVIGVAVKGFYYVFRKYKRFHRIDSSTIS